MTTDRIQFGDGVELLHQELTDEQRRFLRAQYLLTEMSQEQVLQAIEDKKLSPGTVEFISGVAEKVMRVQNGELEPDDILQLELERMEDAHMWTRRHVELTTEQKQQVVT